MNNSRIAIFIDGPNFFYMQKDGLKWFADPKRIISWAARRFNGEVTEARYYQSVDPERPSSGETFLKALPYMGYSVHKKHVKVVRDCDEQWVEANVTIPMMLDMWDIKDNLDVLILVSGDGDFTEIAERLKQRGKQVVVLSTDGEGQNFLSNDLRATVGQWYIDLNSIRDDVKKDH